FIRKIAIRRPRSCSKPFARRGGKSGIPHAPLSARLLEPTIFVIEKNARLRELLRDNLRGMGFRVFIAGDPTTALQRFRQQPCDALIMDAGALDDDEIFDFDRILSAAEKKRHPSAGILILSETQAGWKDRIPTRKQTAVLVRPVTLKQLAKRLKELM